MAEPAARPSLGRRLAGLAVGLLLLVCLAYPLGVVGLLTSSSFTGCFIDCAEPHPGRGLLWSAVAAVLLAVPIGLGLAVAGVRSRGAWWATAGAVLAVVTGWDLISILG